MQNLFFAISFLTCISLTPFDLLQRLVVMSLSMLYPAIEWFGDTWSGNNYLPKFGNLCHPFISSQSLLCCTCSMIIINGLLFFINLSVYPGPVYRWFWRRTQFHCLLNYLGNGSRYPSVKNWWLLQICTIVWLRHPIAGILSAGILCIGILSLYSLICHCLHLLQNVWIHLDVVGGKWEASWGQGCGGFPANLVSK